MERFFGPRRDPVHVRKCAKGASLHRNCISMPEMAAMGPVFRGAGLRYEIDVASYQAKRIPCREPLAFSWIIGPAEGPHCAIFCHDALVWTQWTIRKSAASLRMLVACRLPHVALRAARRLPFAANLPVLSIVVCRLPLGAWCLPFCLAAAVCPWPLGSVARRFPLALAPFRPRSAFRRLLRAFAIPPIAAC